MNYTKVTNPQWANAEHTVINCFITSEQHGEIPFSAVASGDYPYTHEIYRRCLAGEFGVIAEYLPPTPRVPTAEENKAMAINLLNQTDWVSVADIANPAISNPHLTNQAEFLTYRSKVRAIAINPTAGNINWPTKPTTKWS